MDNALKRLKDDLFKKKIYHRIVAARLGVDRSLVTHWLNGTKDIKYTYLKFISEEMAGIPLADLFEESDIIYKIKTHLRQLDLKEQRFFLRFLPQAESPLSLPEHTQNTP